MTWHRTGTNQLSHDDGLLHWRIYASIDLFHNNFSSSDEQPEHRKLAHELKQPTTGWIAIFHKYYYFTKRGGITTKLTLRNHKGYINDVSKYHNAGIWAMYWNLRFMYKNI